MEIGERPVTSELARSAATLYRLPATALPMPEPPRQGKVSEADQLARQLAGLGYPLDSGTCALPWVLLTYSDLDWSWLVRHAKLEDAQNRLGFLVAVAKSLAAERPELEPAFRRLSAVEQQLEHARLAREDTLCRQSMPLAERRWLKENRSALARHWNLLTGLTIDHLSYAH